MEKDIDDMIFGTTETVPSQRIRLRFSAQPDSQRVKKVFAPLSKFSKHGKLF